MYAVLKRGQARHGAHVDTVQTVASYRRQRSVIDVNSYPPVNDVSVDCRQTISTTTPYAEHATTNNKKRKYTRLISSYFSYCYSLSVCLSVYDVFVSLCVCVCVCVCGWAGVMR